MLKGTGGGTLARMKAAGQIRALGVLVRKYPKATIHSLAAGVWQAARVGFGDLKGIVRRKRIAGFAKHYTPLRVPALRLVRKTRWYSVRAKDHPSNGGNINPTSD